MARKRRRTPARSAGEGVDHVVCRLCRKAFRAVSWTHLVKKHHADPEHPILEYKARFDLKRAVCEETTELSIDSVKRHYDRVGRKWTIETIRDAIHRERAAGKDLSSRAVTRRQWKLVAAAVRIFGTWPKALRAAGLDPLRHRKTHHWTAEEVVARIRRHAETLPSREIRALDPKLADGARQVFGSWKKAVEAAGVPWQVAHFWTREAILEALRARHRKGKSLTLVDIVRELPGVSNAVKREFGTYWEALRALGIDPGAVCRRRPTPWTRDQVLDRIAVRRSKGRSLAPRDIRADEEYGLVKAGTKLFGGWPNALRAAGLDPADHLLRRPDGAPPPPPKRQGIAVSPGSEPEDYVLCRICSLGFPILAPSHLVNVHGWPAATAMEEYRRRFPDAPLRAGRVVAQGRAKQRARFERLAQEWTRAKVLETLVRLSASGFRLTLSEAKQRHLALVNAAVRLFGGWYEALREAHVTIPPPPPLPPPPNKLSPEAIRRRIAELGSRGESLAAKHINRRHYGLYRAARREFGSWDEAVRAVATGAPSAPTPTNEMSAGLADTGEASPRSG